MKTQKEIFSWLKANLGPRCLGVLTSTDSAALVASVNLSNLISYESAPDDLFAAYRAIVMAMQPQARYLAYHAIACELDWSHRSMIWVCSDLVHENPFPVSVCAFEPHGSARSASGTTNLSQPCPENHDHAGPVDESHSSAPRPPGQLAERQLRPTSEVAA